MSRLRRIAALLDGGTDSIDGLDANAASELDSEVCRLIIENLDVGGANLAPMLRLAAGAARADYHRPLEIFTVTTTSSSRPRSNSSALRISTGSSAHGALHARFRTDLVEAGPDDEMSWLPNFRRSGRVVGEVHRGSSILMPVQQR
ncbi:MAG: hypothetical protein ACRDK0_08860 [Solirubrobacteraceae bacterium]